MITTCRVCPISIASHNASLLLFFVFILSVLVTDISVQALSSNTKAPFLRRIRSVIPKNLPLSLPWYENGLEFSCTGCSKCCQVDGDVWVAPEEVVNIVRHLGLEQGQEQEQGPGPGQDQDGMCRDELSSSTIDDFRKKYVRAEITPADGDRSQSWMNLKRNEGSCVFLDESGKCGIYDARPVQCHTYPFWPSLLENSEAWKEEFVLPDDSAIEEGSQDRHWSPELGGCEGIGKIIDAVAAVPEADLKNIDLDKLYSEQQDIVIVQRQEIQEKRRQARKIWKRFPVDDIKRSTWYL